MLYREIWVIINIFHKMFLTLLLWQTSLQVSESVAQRGYGGDEEQMLSELHEISTWKYPLQPPLVKKESTV